MTQPPRRCVHCRARLPEGSRADRRTCSEACRQALSRSVAVTEPASTVTGDPAAVTRGTRWEEDDRPNRLPWEDDRTIDPLDHWSER